MITMTDAAIAVLNAAYAAALAASPAESTHVITRQIARDHNLEIVETDDESGWLFARYPDGARVYGWQSGGFEAPATA